MSVELIASRGAREAPNARLSFAALVTLHNEPHQVRVRFRRTRAAGTNQWWCDQCGAHPFATCPHAHAAAAAWRDRNQKEATP